MTKSYFQFMPQGFVMFKDQTRTTIAETIPYVAILEVSMPSASTLLIKSKIGGFALVFKEEGNYSVDWQKSLLMLQDKESDNKDGPKEVDLTYLSQPFKLRSAKSWYVFNYKETASTLAKPVS